MEPRASWVLLKGTYRDAWRDSRRVYETTTFRAQVEELASKVQRTLFIEGKVRNVPSVRGNTGLAARTAFDHGGHLIACRFGGPTCAENLVPMHGAVNGRGWHWSRMEDEVSQALGNEQGMMRVRVSYPSADTLRPNGFAVELQLARGARRCWQIDNHAAYLADPRDPELWRTRLLEAIRRRKLPISTDQRTLIWESKSVQWLQQLVGKAAMVASATELFRD